jgi:hypothetical protein
MKRIQVGKIQATETAGKIELELPSAESFIIGKIKEIP